VPGSGAVAAGATKRARARTRRRPPRATRQPRSHIQYSLLVSYVFYCSSTILSPIIQTPCELLEPGRDRDVTRRALEQRAQRLGHRHLAADQRLDDTLELRRMGRRAHDPRSRRLSRCGQMIVNPEPRRRVRAPNLAVALIVLRNLAAYRLIVNGICLDRVAQ